MKNGDGKKMVVSIRLYPHLLKRIKKMEAKHKISRQEIIEDAILSHLMFLEANAPVKEES